MLKAESSATHYHQHFFFFYCHEEVVRSLLEKAAQINTEDTEYRSTLSAASLINREGVVRFLKESASTLKAERTAARHQQHRMMVTRR